MRQDKGPRSHHSPLLINDHLDYPLVLAVGMKVERTTHVVEIMVDGTMEDSLG